MYANLKNLLLLKHLRGNLSTSRAELEEIQRKSLMRLLQHAYDNTVYYRDLFDSAGLKPADIRTVGDLAYLPTTGKLDLQSLGPDDILANGVTRDQCVEDITSGSSGIPLRVYFTRQDYVFRSLLFIRTFLATGYRLTHRQAIVSDTRFVSQKKQWFEKLGVLRKQYIPVHLALPEQITILRRFKPDYIHGYPSSLALIADAILATGVRGITPSVVCTGAELVGPNTRRLIDSAFGVALMDTYAAIETGIMAWQCKQRKGYHINIDGVVLEFLHEGRPAMGGQPGRVVVTNLHSYAMPIIRYELGDLCVPSAEFCSCGVELPLMSVVEGRIDDVIYTPSGRAVSPNSITNAMESVRGIKQFRIVQDQRDRLQVYLVKKDDQPDDVVESSLKALNSLLFGELAINTSLVKDIPREYTGKIRAVISEVGKNK